MKSATRNVESQEDSRLEEQIPRKLYFKIGEVCEITGIPAHVLRFWEKHFPQLSPNKTQSGHRLYRRKDIVVALRIKDLLYERKFTIKGAREYLASSGEGEVESAASPTAEEGIRLGRLKEGLLRMRSLLQEPPSSPRRS